MNNDRSKAPRVIADPQQAAIQRSLAQAWQHQSAGRLPQAADIYQEILKTAPEEPAALHLLGVVAHQRGESGRAIELISKAIAIKPDFAEAHSNLGLALMQSGRLDDAVASYRRAIAIKPGLAGAHGNMGLALHKLDRLEEAATSVEQALAIRPGDAKAHGNLGLVLLDQGRIEDAAASYRAAISIDPKFAEAHAGLGRALRELGQLEAAAQCYRAALGAKPDFAVAHANLGLTLRDLGRMDEALECHRHAVVLAPDADIFWVGFAEALEPIRFTSTDDDLHDDLVSLLERPNLRPDLVTQPILSALRCHQDFPHILESALGTKTELAWTELGARLSAIPLLLRIIELTPINDLEVEAAFTRLRRAMLREAVAGDVADTSLPFAAALAQHCFVNEYVFQETPEETAEVGQLENDLAALVNAGGEVPPGPLMALASYRPLHRFPWAGDLPVRNWTRDGEAVITRQVREPIKERALRDQIRKATPIQDSVSLAVRAQYEENPYPIWVKTHLGQNPKTLGDDLRGPPMRFDLGDYESPERPETLIAGCGTGQHALQTASRFSNARVLAVDLSQSSLAYATRKTRELGLSNIEYAQADIMELGGLGREFDVIESSGVLHHLRDPVAGWRILLGLLRPGGLMKIGLYSEIARRPLEKARAAMTGKGRGASPENIRKLRQDLIAIRSDPAISKVVRLKDFFSLSECRDLLFHVQEHQFTLPQIETALASLGLEFLGFETRNQNVLRSFLEAHPDKGARTSLSRWHEFECENPDTFAGMYQFWCRKR